MADRKPSPQPDQETAREVIYGQHPSQHSMADHHHQYRTSFSGEQCMTQCCARGLGASVIPDPRTVFLVTPAGVSRGPSDSGHAKGGAVLSGHAADIPQQAVATTPGGAECPSIITALREHGDIKTMSNMAMLLNELVESQKAAESLKPGPAIAGSRGPSGSGGMPSQVSSFLQEETYACGFGIGKLQLCYDNVAKHAEDFCYEFLKLTGRKASRGGPSSLMLPCCPCYCYHRLRFIPVRYSPCPLQGSTSPLPRRCSSMML